jgi:indolepyruvate ferredoxin oxidoreductase beta subunit
VACDVRFGVEILSPMVPAGEADFLLALEAAQLEPNRHLLRPGGVTLEPSGIDMAQLPQKKMLNVALLGALSARLPMEQSAWLESVRAAFDPKHCEGNRKAFLLGRASQEKKAEGATPGTDDPAGHPCLNKNQEKK